MRLELLLLSLLLCLLSLLRLEDGISLLGTAVLQVQGGTDCQCNQSSGGSHSYEDLIRLVLGGRQRQARPDVAWNLCDDRGCTCTQAGVNADGCRMCHTGIHACTRHGIQATDHEMNLSIRHFARRDRHFVLSEVWSKVRWIMRA